MIIILDLKVCSQNKDNLFKNSKQNTKIELHLEQINLG